MVHSKVRLWVSRWKEIVKAICGVVGAQNDNLQQSISARSLLAWKCDTHKDPSPQIFHSKAEAVPNGAISLRQRNTIQSDALLCQLALISCEKPHPTARYRLRKVDEYDESNNGGDHATSTLEDE